jgi:predicted nucleic acid-binding protein
LSFHFIDTSSLLKLFVIEVGSAKMSQFSSGEDDKNKVISSLSPLEARSAICRLRRSKLLSPSQHSSALDSLERDIQQMIEQPVSPLILDTAKSIVDRHHLRALDAIQLGSAIVARELLAAQDMRFISSDLDLLDAARAEGFETWNPCDQPA